jgi:hypothetical protein
MERLDKSSITCSRIVRAACQGSVTDSWTLVLAVGANHRRTFRLRGNGRWASSADYAGLAAVFLLQGSTEGQPRSVRCAHGSRAPWSCQPIYAS